MAFIFLLLFLGIMFFSADSFIVAKEALNTWFTVLVPSLFIFLILIDIINKSGIMKFFGVLLEPIMKPLFNVSGIGAFPFLIGLTCGYPAGAKIIKDLYLDKKISHIEAQRLLAFTNNCSPSFIMSAVAVGLLNSPELSIKLLLIHHISVILVGICFRFYKYKNTSPQNISNNLLHKAKLELSSATPLTTSSIAPLLIESIKNATMTMVTIGGFVILFRVILNLLINLKIITLLALGLKALFLQIGFPLKLASPILAGMIEVTTGLNMLATISVPMNFILIAICFLLSFGGITVMFQVAGVLVGTDISIKTYIFGKLLQAIFATLISWRFLCI